ncbi:hypothetical protein BI364_04450 [Acidihalobacter yilgarnensis]|uniref:ChrR-like cupin domain-containing protein n=1 Tax=Acidihalobacter yilgarnensis TaxID=2819280 RepID=A0A1D8ILN7_9GAMM|nr:cupin domain-containing protein [Acidihalobacter yilgarnensis]AOU97341.1 hypothetical protein BI364_04450 [Acidihalobacter yilgarnensis]
MNANPTLRAFVDGVRVDRQASLSPGGAARRHKPLYRMGGESGSVIGVVRYAPGRCLSAHPHSADEAFFMRSGVFSDERGDYPAGSGLLKPEGVVHAPYSASGWEFAVGLRQYPGAGGARRRQSAYAMATWCAGIDVSGLSLLPCYRDLGASGVCHHTAQADFSFERGMLRA